MIFRDKFLSSHDKPID